MAFILNMNFVLQTTLFQYIEILGVKPDTALILIVGYGILRGDVEGAIAGFFSGLLQDIYYGPCIGLYAMVEMLLGYFAGKPFKDFYKENALLPLPLVAGASLIRQFAVYFTSFLFRGKVDFAYYLKAIILPASVYTLALAIPFYSLVYWVNRMLEEAEKLNRKLF
jgi:rod shape-determining protein MreD